MKNGIIFLTLLCQLGAVAPALANRVGNGGDGYIDGEKVYVLDLVEAGVEQDPFLEEGIQPDAAVVARIQKAVPFVNAEAAALLSRKLKEIEKKDLKLSWALLTTIEVYHWVLVAPGLLDIPDEESNIDPTKLVQLAIRNGRRIQVSRPHWPSLEPVQQAALILHEVAYAMIKPEQRGNGYIQNSPKNRELIGLLFSAKFRTLSRADFVYFIDENYPVAEEGQMLKSQSKVLFSVDGLSGTFQFANKCSRYQSVGLDGSSNVCRCMANGESNVPGKIQFSPDAGQEMKFTTFVDDLGRQREYVEISSADYDTYPSNFARSISLVLKSGGTSCQAKVKQAADALAGHARSLGFRPNPKK